MRVGMKSLLTRGGVVVLCCLPGTVAGIEFTCDLRYQKNGPATSNLLGFSLEKIGDIDGDGVADFIVGAPWTGPGYPTWAGSAFVYSGATGALLYQKDGNAGMGEGDELGKTVAGCGDINGDGRADFIVGAPIARPGGRRWAGAAYVYSGLDGSLLFEKVGVDSFDLVGSTVAGAGDVNGDGRADFMVAAGLSIGGSVSVYSGVDGGLLHRKDTPFPGQNDGFGYSFSNAIAGVGDVNGDGKGDFAIGAHWASIGDSVEAGTVFVYSGSNGALLYRKDGTRYNAEMGFSVAGTGDVNGDGKGDIIIGAPYFPGELPVPGFRGKAYVISGPTGATLFELNNPDLHQGQFGWSVRGAGDVDGDGRPDVIVGAPSMDIDARRDAGSAFVFSGVTGALICKIDGSAENAEFGWSVSGAGDLDGDGRAEIVVGAWRADPNGILDAGSAFVYSLRARGDMNNDVKLTPADVVFMLMCVFLQTGTCDLSAADLDCDGQLGSADVVLELNGVFLGATTIACSL